MSTETLAKLLHCFVDEGDGRSQRPKVAGIHADGHLSGASFGVKDVIDVAGEPTGAGCSPPRAAKASISAAVVEQLLAAGALYAGKTHTVQLAFGGWGTNTCVGAPRNPWDADAFRIAGGSSSGSAVAVASGLVDFALGTDTGGSIRIPAALCGIVGLKPSWGAVSTHGVAPLAPSLDSVGIIASNAGMAARSFAVVAQRQTVARPAILSSLKLRTLIAPDLSAEDDVCSAYASAIAGIRAAGGKLIGMGLPVPPGDYVLSTGRILGYEAWDLHGEFVKTQSCMDNGVYQRFLSASRIKGSDYLAALAQRVVDQSNFERWFEGADVLITPTTPHTATRLETVDESDFTLARFTRMANYLNLCGLTLPCGFDRLGLPIGLQLLARSGAEELLLAAAKALESILLDKRVPPLHVLRMGDTCR